MTLFDLSGRVAVVTGGNGGIGLGYAKGLAGAGCTVSIWGRNEAKNAAAVETLSPITMAALIGLDPALLGAMRSENVPLQQSRGLLAVLPVTPVATLPPLAVFSRRSRLARPPVLERFVQALHWAAAKGPGRQR